MKDYYNELLFKRGYATASLYAYLENIADEDGKIITSVAELTKVTGLSTQSVRTMLNYFHLTNKQQTTNKQISIKSTNKSTIITINSSVSCEVEKKGNQQTKKRASNKQLTNKQQTKEAPPSPPLNVPPIPPSLSPPIIPQESTVHQSACERFEVWLSEHCPYIRKHYKMMTEVELEKLKQQYGAELIAETCSDIENRIDLRKRYSHLYRTLLNWLKKRNENNRTTNQRIPTTAAERLDAAAQLVYRLGQEDDGALWQP